MKAEDWRAKTGTELQTALLDLRKEQMNLRFQRASGQLEKTARIREVRRDIARVKTIMTGRTNTAETPDLKAAPAEKPKKTAAKKTKPAPEETAAAKKAKPAPKPKIKPAPKAAPAKKTAQKGRKTA